MTNQNQCFTRNRRLHHTTEFQYVFNYPCKSSTRYFTILYRSNGISNSRLGLAISKKIIRKAVDRNRLKRVIRESFRLNQNKIGAFDIVVLAKKEIEKVSRRSLHENLEHLWIAIFRV